mmetsp:Transcript_174003/g.557838  ORF Transcript_174003/g.557838 Transcript_174003/m.557838 type:complete len:251 (-) Transcript_174003:864-1616(-)
MPQSTLLGGARQNSEDLDAVNHPPGQSALPRSATRDSRPLLGAAPTRHTGSSSSSSFSSSLDSSTEGGGPAKRQGSDSTLGAASTPMAMLLACAGGASLAAFGRSAQCLWYFSCRATSSVSTLQAFGAAQANVKAPQRFAASSTGLRQGARPMSSPDSSRSHAMFSARSAVGRFPLSRLSTPVRKQVAPGETTAPLENKEAFDRKEGSGVPARIADFTSEAFLLGGLYGKWPSKSTYARTPKLQMSVWVS